MFLLPMTHEYLLSCAELLTKYATRIHGTIWGRSSRFWQITKSWTTTKRLRCNRSIKNRFFVWCFTDGQILNHLKWRMMNEILVILHCPPPPNINHTQLSSYSFVFQWVEKCFSKSLWTKNRYRNWFWNFISILIWSLYENIAHRWSTSPV